MWRVPSRRFNDYEDYILKPINADELRSRLGHILDRKRTQLALERSERLFRELAKSIDQVFSNLQ